MKSLLYMFNGRFPTEKAHGIQIAKMCEAFANIGVAVTLTAPYRRNNIRQDPFEYYGVQRNFALRRVWAMDLMNSIPDRFANFIQTVTSAISFGWYLLGHRAEWYYARDPASLLALSFFGRPYVAELHDYRARQPRWWMKRILKKARLVVCNSEGTKKLLAAHYTLSTILVAPNGVDPKFFDIPETREKARELLNLPQDKVIIGYVGRFEVAGMDKGIPSLVEAFGLMRHRDQAKLLLVGSPELSVPYTHVPLYLRAIDIAIIPFPDAQHAKTTSPIKLFEFMAAGKAIVVADSSDPQRLAETLDALVTNPERIRLLGVQAREEAKHHTWDQRARAIIDFLNLR